MTEFERMLVNSLNAYIEENGLKAISYRLKQHRFTPQFLDVLVDRKMVRKGAEIRKYRDEMQIRYQISALSITFALSYP